MSARARFLIGLGLVAVTATGCPPPVPPGPTTTTTTAVPGCVDSEAALRAAAAAGGSFCVDATSPIVLTSGQLDVPTTLSLTSSGGAVNAVIDAGDASRVVDVTGSLTLDGMTVTGGAASDGAGIRVNGSAALTLDGSTSIIDNDALVGGGGIHNGGVLVMNDTSRVGAPTGASPGGNTAPDGGGVYNAATGQMTMNDSSAVGELNTATDRGSGIFNEGDLAMTADATVRGHAGSLGGNIYNAGTMTMDGSATLDGQGVFALEGGCIYNEAGQVTMNGTSSVANCGTSGSGAGIKNRGGSVILNDSASITGNTTFDNIGGGVHNVFPTGSVELNDASIIADNIAQYGGGIATRGLVTLNGTSSVTSNLATVSGGGISVSQPGGAVVLNGGTVTGNTPDDCSGC